MPRMKPTMSSIFDATMAYAMIGMVEVASKLARQSSKFLPHKGLPFESQKTKQVCGPISGAFPRSLLTFVPSQTVYAPDSQGSKIL